jgi:hypothetical protein
MSLVRSKAGLMHSVALSGRMAGERRVARVWSARASFLGLRLLLNF